MRRIQLQQLRDYLQAITEKEAHFCLVTKDDSNPQVQESYIEAKARLELAEAIWLALDGDAAMLLTFVES